MFTLAHLSDPHLPMPQARVLDLLDVRHMLSKRWEGLE